MRNLMNAVAIIGLLGVASAAHAGGVFVENPGHFGQVSDNPGNANVSIESDPNQSSSSADVGVNPPPGSMDVGNNTSEEVSGNDAFTNSPIEVSIFVDP